MFPEAIMLDYTTLRLIWWAILGILLAGFAVMDGFDLGVATLLPVLGKTDEDRRVMLNTVGPVWEGNQVWLILGAGAIFAAWPTVYALAFSGFYIAMFLLLCTLILRPVGFKYRQKIDSPRWKKSWDTCLFISGATPSLVFGVAVGNAMQGVPFHFDDTMRISYTGSFLELFNPFALLCGLLSLTMLTMHGAVFLTLKADPSLVENAQKIARRLVVLTLLLFSLGGIWTSQWLTGYRIIGEITTDGPSNPLLKGVASAAGAYWSNFSDYPIFLIAPAMVYLGGLLLILALAKAWYGRAFIFSGMAVGGTVLTAGVTMFPFILPSSSTLESSLTVWDASSSRNTLFVMLLAVVIFLPIILAYTSWVYHVLRGRVTKAYIRENSKTVY